MVPCVLECDSATDRGRLAVCEGKDGPRGGLVLSEARQTGKDENHAISLTRGI